MTVALRLQNRMLSTSLKNNLFQGCQFPSTVNHSDVAQRRVTLCLRMPPVPRILPQLFTRFLQLGCHLRLPCVMLHVFELHHVTVLHLRMVQEIRRHPQVPVTLVQLLLRVNHKVIRQVHVNQVQRLHRLLPLQVIPDARLRTHLLRKILEHLPNSSSNLSFIAMS